MVDARLLAIPNGVDGSWTFDGNLSSPILKYLDNRGLLDTKTVLYMLVAMVKWLKSTPPVL